MTAAGIAFIAGGLATLITFRAVLFGAGGRRARRAATGTIAGGKPRRGRGSRRRSAAAAFSGRPVEAIALPAPRAGSPMSRGDGERQGGLASIGLADEDEADFDDMDAVADEIAAARYDEAAEPDQDEDDSELDVETAEEEDAFEGEGAEAAAAELPIHPAPARRVDRSDRRYGDRVEGWVRPRYSDLPVEPPSGEYWTPIPGGRETDPEPSARGYGWPVPVERLPAVPPYEPATGFDLTPIESEPTEFVPAWPRVAEDRPGRIRLPRSWAARDERRLGTEGPENTRDRVGPRYRDRLLPSAATELIPPVRDSTQLFAALDDEPPPARPAGQRRRPRPRPRPGTPADGSTAVYVSRHAAEPPR